MTISRRTVLTQIGIAGGVGAAYSAMQMLGLAWATPASARGFALPAASGQGRSVLVLGAGIAGLVSALQLQRAGYRVTVLEAQERVGGRVLTLRGGDRIAQMGRAAQRVDFSDGLYFNAGAARIPSTHHVILDYARDLGVAMEVFVNSNRSAGWDFGGQVHPERRMIHDLKGGLMELLGKAIDQGALDREMPKDELAQLRRFLGPYASVGPNGYAPDGRNGYKVEPGGYAQAPVPLDRLTLRQALPSGATVLPHLFESIFDMQAPMLQPVGGMDRIPLALYAAVKPLVRLGTPVIAIRRTATGVRVEHGGSASEADYCVCTLPAPILSRIPSDFAPAKKEALKKVVYLPSVKVAFEAPRFWEDEGIYGGCAWTDRLNENLIYPSDGMHSKRGVLVAAYVAGWTHNDNPQKFADLSDAERLRISSESVEALHPGKARLLDKGLTVGWGSMPWAEGVGAIWSDGPPAFGGREDFYAELLKPEGPIVFAGEHLSYAGLWQEGAALSAHEALKLVQAMAVQKAAA